MTLVIASFMLCQIWEDILGFENAEFYIKRWPQLDGRNFEEVLVSFPDAIPCGIKVAADGGKIILNPDDKYVLKEGDEVIVIAEDDDTYSPGPIAEVSRFSCSCVLLWYRPAVQNLNSRVAGTSCRHTCLSVYLFNKYIICFLLTLL